MAAPSTSVAIPRLDGAPLFAVQATFPGWSPKWLYWDETAEEIRWDDARVDFWDSRASAQAWLDEHQTCCIEALLPDGATFTIRRLHLEATDG